MISADNFWIELDRLLGGPTTAAQMEDIMKRYVPVWPDIHDQAKKAQTTLSLDESLGHFGDDASGGSGEDRVARGVIRLPPVLPPFFASCPCA
jgi:hypothetical protein